MFMIHKYLETMNMQALIQEHTLELHLKRESLLTCAQKTPMLH